MTRYQEREIQHKLASTDTEKDANKFPPFLKIGGTLSNSPALESQNEHPTRWQAVQLWQVFVNNVDPLTKILHIPTAQPTVFEAINNPRGAARDVNALLFAIYFAATTSLQKEDVNHLLGQEKSVAIEVLKQGLEKALEHANLLDNPTLTSIQALAIYLVSLLFLSVNVVHEPSSIDARDTAFRPRTQRRQVSLDSQRPCHPIGAIHWLAPRWKEL
jgi:hypothetical protein